MKNIDTVIFDLDGTLLYTLDDLKDSVNYTLSLYGYQERSLAEITSFVGNGLERLMELSLGQRPENFKEIFQVFKQHYDKNCDNKTRFYDGIYELLTALKGKYKMAVVTNKNETSLQVIKKVYFDGLIDVFVGQREGLNRKPAPDGVFIALDKLKSKAENSIYIGDSEVDVQTAFNAGLPLIACLWGFRDEKTLREYGATVFAKKPSDILDILER